MKPESPPDPDPLLGVVERLRHAKKTADAETESARASAYVAEARLVEVIGDGEQTAAAEKEVRASVAAVASAEVRQRATAAALEKAETALEEAGRKTEIERQRAIHETAVSAYGLARERLAVAWADFEAGFSDLVGLQVTARYSFEAAKDLGADFVNVISQDPLSYSELCRLRSRVNEILTETARAGLDPPPPEITVCGYSASRLKLH